jgi:hypothetical protein
MRHNRLHARSFEWLCACLILAPCAALAQQNGTAPKAAAAGADSAQSAPTPASAEGTAPNATPSAAQGHATSAAPAHEAPAKQDDVEPAVDTSDDAARARAGSGHNAKPEARARASGKAMDHLDLGTTDITGNRELPKVMYIVPWKRSDLGDLTGKPLNSLVDQTLQPVDRNEFERSNRYYGAVTAGASTAGTPSAGTPGAGASQDAHRTPGAASGSAARDER